MKSKFFTKNRSELSFEWNAASNRDWAIIRRNFVSAYLCAYRNCSLEELKFSTEVQQKAEEKWEIVYQKSIEQRFDLLVSEIIKPLQFYLNHEDTPLEKEYIELKEHFLDQAYDISFVREKMIKLIMLQDYFEREFAEEKHKLNSGKKDYLIIRFHEQPIAFFVSELNYKSAHIYLRFVTMEPAFHRLGLGEKALGEIAKHYPDATGMELYTRKANHSARSFYEHCGFQAFTQFDFEEPMPTLNQAPRLHFPDDDVTCQPEVFIAFSKTTYSYQG